MTVSEIPFSTEWSIWFIS